MVFGEEQDPTGSAKVDCAGLELERANGKEEEIRRSDLAVDEPSYTGRSAAKTNKWRVK
jgi:hypothetical protein